MVSTPGATLPVPIAAIMLSPPPARNAHACAADPVRRQSSARSGKLAFASTNGGRQVARSRSGIGGGQHLRGPVPRAHVEPAGAGSIAIFHPALAGEPEIHVVVGQQDRRQPCVDFRPVPARPGQVWTRYSRPGSGCRPARCSARHHPPRRMISSHSACVLVSHHSFAGASTLPAASSGTNPCCCPDTPMAVIRARSAGSSTAKQSRMASIHHCGPLLAGCHRRPRSAAAACRVWQRSGATQRPGQPVSRSGCPHPAR